MTDDEYHKDRRVDIADVKIATLEERSLATAATQARIEKKLDDHIVSQTEWQESHAAEESKNWAKVSEALAVINIHLNKNKVIISTVMSIAGTIWAGIVIFKDDIVRYFTK